MTFDALKDTSTCTCAPAALLHRTGAAHQAQHRLVLGQHQRVEALDPLIERVCRERLKERRPETLPLPVVEDRNRRLRREIARADEPCDSHDFLTVGHVNRHERHVVVLIDDSGSRAARWLDGPSG